MHGWMGAMVHADSPASEVRLVHGTAMSEGVSEAGILQVRPKFDDPDMEAPWGTVCAASFDSNAAQVVCRQLGYESGSVQAGVEYRRNNGFPSVQDDEETSPYTIWFDYDMECTGREGDLRDCANSWSSGACTEGADLAITCSRDAPWFGGDGEA